MFAVTRMLIKLVHHLIAAPQIIDRFKKRHHIHAAEEPRLLNQREELEHVFFLVRHAEDIRGRAFGVHLILNLADAADRLKHLARFGRQALDFCAS